MLRIFMAAAAFAIAAANAVAAESASQPQTDPFASPIEQCLRDNAAKVEAAIPDLDTAVEFLVVKVCASQIAEHNQERQRFVQQRNFDNMQKLCDEQTAAKAADASKSDASKSAGVDYCQLIKNAQRAMMQPLPYDPWAPGMVINASNEPPAAVALAAQLLLELRAAHKHRS